MSQLTPKKLILFGLAVILLVAIPITVYLVGKQQELKSRAAPSTTLTFQPSSATAAVGQDVTFDIMINPNSNFVSFVHLVISYDPTKLEKSGVGLSINTNVFPGFDPSKSPLLQHLIQREENNSRSGSWGKSKRFYTKKQYQSRYSYFKSNCFYARHYYPSYLWQ